MRTKDLLAFTTAMITGILIVAYMWGDKVFDPGSTARLTEVRQDSGQGGSEGAGPPASPAAVPSLVAESQEEVRETVHYARGAGPGEIPTLRQLALGSDDPVVAGNAIRALGRLCAFTADRDLVDLLDHPQPRIRQESIRALGTSRDPSAVAHLATVLRLENPDLRPLAIQALGRLGGDRARDLLEKLVTDRNTTGADRIFASAALRSLREPR